MGFKLMTISFQGPSELLKQHGQ